jgi:hypothetical protein
VGVCGSATRHHVVQHCAHIQAVQRVGRRGCAGADGVWMGLFGHMQCRCRAAGVVKGHCPHPCLPRPGGQGRYVVCSHQVLPQHLWSTCVVVWAHLCQHPFTRLRAPGRQRAAACVAPQPHCCTLLLLCPVARCALAAFWFSQGGERGGSTLVDLSHALVKTHAPLRPVWMHAGAMGGGEGLVVHGRVATLCPLLLVGHCAAMAAGVLPMHPLTWPGT